MPWQGDTLIQEPWAHDAIDSGQHPGALRGAACAGTKASRLDDARAGAAVGPVRRSVPGGSGRLVPLDFDEGLYRRLLALMPRYRQDTG